MNEQQPFCKKAAADDILVRSGMVRVFLQDLATNAVAARDFECAEGTIS